MFFINLHHAPFLVNCTVGEKPPEPESQAEPEPKSEPEPEQQAQAEPEPQQEEKVKSPEPQQKATEEKKGLSYREAQNRYEMRGCRTLVKSA